MTYEQNNTQAELSQLIKTLNTADSLVGDANEEFKISKKHHQVFKDSLEMMSLEEPRDQWGARLDKTKTCGNYQTRSINEDGKRYLVSAGFCRDRLCPVCVDCEGHKFMNTIYRIVNFNQINMDAEPNSKIPELDTVDLMNCFYATFSIGQTNLERLQITISVLQNSVRELLKSDTLQQLGATGAMRRLFIERIPHTNDWHPYIKIIFELGDYYKGEYKTYYFKTACETMINECWKNITLKIGVPEQHIDITTWPKQEDITKEFKGPAIQPRAYLTDDIDFNKVAIKALSQATQKLRFMEIAGHFRKLRKTLKEISIKEGGFLKPKRAEKDPNERKMHYIGVGYEKYTQTDKAKRKDKIDIIDIDEEPIDMVF